MTLRRLQYGSLALALFLLAWGSAYADSTADDYRVRPDVLNSGGVDFSKSLNYLLSDSIGESIVGPGQSDDYRLDSGYRQQSAADFLSMTCSASAAIGSAAGTGQRTGSGTCVVYTDAYGGYNLSWAILSGSGGTNTGYLINQYNDGIAPFDFSRSGLVGYWKMDETVAGSTVKDYSGNGKNGTPSGSGGGNNLPQPNLSLPTNMNVADTRSLNFDGTDDAVSFTVVPLPSGLTFSVWVQTTSADTTGGLSNLADPIFGDSAGSIYTHFGMHGGKARYNPYVTDWTSPVDGTNAINDGAWHHIAVTHTTAGAVKLYVDGSLDVSTTKTYETTYFKVDRIGTSYIPDGKYFAGSLDDARVYSRALTLAEIQALYRTPHTWSVASNVAGWGSRLRSNSTDTDAKWGTDNSTDKWLNIGDGNYSVVTRGSATAQAGSTEIFQFRGEIGSAVLQPTGSYQATAIFTVVGY